MGLNKWVKDKFTGLILSLHNVEKQALGQQSVELDSDSATYQRHLQGTLADALVQGEITEEVKNLRWRLYKVLEASNSVIANIVDYDEEGYPITNTEAYNESYERTKLNKITLDSHDDYQLELSLDNRPITKDTLSVINNKSLTGTTEIEETKDDNGVVTSTTIAKIDSDSYYSSMNTDQPIKIVRELRSKFELEKYTKKLNVRNINDKEKLLEFYVSQYPDEYDRKTRLFISEIKRAMVNPRASNMLEIDGVGFTTYKTVGVKDFLQYEYQIKSFDKIVEFNGHYIIKFKADVILNGEYLLDKYRMANLDDKYKNKEAK
jgi:hypothetical protein